MKCNYLIIIYLVLMISFTNYSQSHDVQIKNQKGQYLKSYIKFGFGKLNNYINFGGGFFFPLSEKIMMGVRANVNSELEVFKTPSENLFDISLSARYVPLIWNDLVTMVGCGVGYAKGEKRGTLVYRPLLVTEQYEKIEINSVSALAELEVGYFLTRFLGVFLSGYSVFTNNYNINTYQFGIFLFGLNEQ